MRNFCELKEHVLTQCKETKNIEKRFHEMPTRINNLETWTTQAQLPARQMGLILDGVNVRGLRLLIHA